MTAPVFVPRSVWNGPGPATNNNGNPRPLLRLPVPTITRHYRGSPINNSATASAVDYMTAMQARALRAGKSFEYNYIIPPGRGDAGEVWEYAGVYRAAHSSGENSTAVGVQFALGVNNYPHAPVWQPIDTGMINAYRWLRDVHLAGVLSIPPSDLEHRHMPGAATACPGQSVIDAAGSLSTPYTPPPSSEDTMQELDTPARWIDGTDLTADTPHTVTAPYGALAVAGNLTVVNGTAGGYVVVYGDQKPGTSNVQVIPGQATDNYTRVKAGPSGTITFEASVNCTIYFDLQAWDLG